MRKQTRRSKLLPRKVPRQGRSQATVEAILEAATHILVRDGYAGLTTNRIAERAGVNVASLYQYFPGKEAIVAELRKRHVAEQREAATRALARRTDSGLTATIHAMVSIGTAVHAVAPRLHRVLTEELPGRPSNVGVLDDELVTEMRRVIADGAVDVPDKDLALWIVDTVAYAVIHRAAVERPQDLSGDLLASELSTLLLRYLQRN